MADACVPDVRMAEKLRADAERFILVSTYLTSLFLAMTKKFRFLHFLFLSLIGSEDIQYDAILKNGDIIQISRSGLLHETWLSYDKSRLNQYQFRTLESSVTENRHAYAVSTYGSEFGVHEFQLRADTQDELFLAVTQIKSTFTDEKWKALNCQGKVVFDVGAGIGDTAMYFASNGATRVIAIEPFGYLFNILQANLEINSLTDRVLPLNRSFGDPVYRVNATDAFPFIGTYYSVNEDSTSSLRLRDLIRLANKEPSVLKISCVGCERSILNESVEDIRYFDQIVIEYVYGYRNLAQKLSNAGFRVNCTSPKGVFGRSAPCSAVYLGMIVANRD